MRSLKATQTRNDRSREKTSNYARELPIARHFTRKVALIRSGRRDSCTPRISPESTTERERLKSLSTGAVPRIARSGRRNAPDAAETKAASSTPWGGDARQRDTNNFHFGSSQFRFDRLCFTKLFVRQQWHALVRRAPLLALHTSSFGSHWFQAQQRLVLP